MVKSRPRIAVIGLGTMGSMALWQLAGQDLDVVGYEQFAAPHDRGSHADRGRFFRVAYHEGSVYVPVALEARELWRRLGAEAGVPILYETGFLTVGDPTQPWIAELLRGAEQFDLPTTTLDGADFSRRFPQHKALFDGEVGVIDELGGAVEAELSVHHALQLARAAGAEVRNYGRVRAIEPEGDGVSVRTDAGSEIYDRVVVTTGAWTDLADRYHSVPVTTNRLIKTWFYPREARQFVAGEFLPFMRQSPGTEDYGVGIAGGALPDGSMVGAGATVPDKQWDVDPEALDLTIPVDYIEKVSAIVSDFLPALYPDPMRTAVYMDGYTPDLRPVIDVVDDRILYMTGFSGHGFKFAPVVGRAAAEWVRTDRMDPLLSPFAASAR